ncbi:MAG: DUF1961 family protein [Planctomycetota bacterium]
MHRRTAQLIAALLAIALTSQASSQEASMTTAADPIAAFNQLASGEWVEQFHDPCTDDWTSRWTLDGRHATLTHSPDGMNFQAGPVNGDDAHHAVLWTRQTFQGDLKIEYDYTKTDERTENVTILYIHATGSGQDPFDADISTWAHLREVPSMRLYFNHMHAYHISYAVNATVNDDPTADYIRLRRYMPDLGQGLKGTDLGPDHFNTGLFKPHQPHKITIIKQADQLAMRVENDEQTRVFIWHTDALPPLDQGRIGLRHMYTRSARYRDFRVSQRP